MIGVFNGVLFMVCWAVTSASLVLLFAWPIIIAIIVGLIATAVGVLVIDMDWDDWF